MDTIARVVTPFGATVSRPERLFPTLTAAQTARIGTHGRRRAMASGEVLVEVGQRPVPFFVVLSGEVQVVRPSAGTEALIVTQGSGQFTGEGTMLTGRRALTRIRAIEPGEVIELDREQLFRGPTQFGLPAQPLACKLLIRKTGRDVRMVEGARLENDSGDAHPVIPKHSFRQSIQRLPAKECASM